MQAPTSVTRGVVPTADDPYAVFQQHSHSPSPHDASAAVSPDLALLAAQLSAIGPEEPVRYVSVFQFMLLLINTTAGMMIYAMVYPEAMSYFHMTKFQVNMFTVSSSIVGILLSFFTIPWFEKHGVQKLLRVASVLNFVCAVLRLIAVLVAPHFGCSSLRSSSWP